MNNYLNDLNISIQNYFKILSKDFPDFLFEYIDTPAMQKQAKISVSCGKIYSKLHNERFWYSSLDHSVGVALIIWNFTKDKKQTLSGLFHDIATPVFKHSIDFMNKDYETQESTEELTTKIISESEEIMNLLKRDGIKIEEVSNYHLYPIADNDTPKLSSDRLEYTLSNGLGAERKIWSLSDIEEIYSNIEVQKNEDGIEELGFKDKEIAEKFVHTMSELSKAYRNERTIFTMQFLGDTIKKMHENNIISFDDLYNLSEKEVIEKIENCNIDNISHNFKMWENATQIKTSEVMPSEKYYVSIEKVKNRYINPLVDKDGTYERICNVSKCVRDDIEGTKAYKTDKYIYLDF